MPIFDLAPEVTPWVGSTKTHLSLLRHLLQIWPRYEGHRPSWAEVALKFHDFHSWVGWENLHFLCS